MRRALSHLLAVTVIGIGLAACATPAGESSASTDAGASEPTLAELTGAWTLTVFSAVDGQRISPVDGSPITLAIDGERASGSDGCNRYSGPVAMDSGRLTFGPLATTRKMCVDPNVMTAATDYLAALEVVTTAQLGPGGMILTGDGVELSFESDLTS